MQSFSELPISAYTKERLASARFVTPTPVQASAIPQALDGKDILATAQTGTGKTLAFLVPLMEKLLQAPGSAIAALVLVPTRELAMQVVDQYNVLRGKQLGPAALVVGGLSEGAQLSAIRKGARLIVATPGRLEDYLDRKLFTFRSLQILVLDEADRMLDMGFLPAIRRIASILPKERQTMLFSATLEASIVHLVKDYLRNPVRLSFGSTLKPSENVRMQAFEVSVDRKHQVLTRLLAKETGRCLVFARTKRATDRITKNLNRDGFSAAMIHGDRSQSQRTSALAGFQQGRFRVLVATDLASRGIHVQDIAHVINFDLPEVAENFIHRVGRTGRAGKHGVASTLFAREQSSELFQLERTLGIRMERLRADDSSKIESILRPPVNVGQVNVRPEAKPRPGITIRKPDTHRTAAAPSVFIGSDAPAASVPAQLQFRDDCDRSVPARKPQIIALPGEVLQVQLEN
jgi:ATP-dependent RNA helicase RhlE